MADETWPRNYSYNVYGKTKAVSEELVIQTKEKDIRNCIIRIPHLFGPSDYLIDATIAMPVIIGSKKDNNNILNAKDKDPYSFIYIENAANVFIVAARALASSETSGQVNGEVFHVKSRDENFIHFYRYTLNEQKSLFTLKIPFHVILFFAYIYELFVLFCFKFFGLQFGDPVQCFGVLAVESCSQEYTFNDVKAQKILKNYNLVDDKEAIQRTRKWIALRNEVKYKKKMKKKTE
ncbi:3-beta-hydroxy-delta5-steroid dehydrogenase [Reticulomyxa filosa]|uniref:3-beta-hydroxy-delta5-steroid dehydrogenase n=1 Tax=Reticulomyxa filosa TaxID=46433 RepID=X6NTZ1_RETFI|nr:3-beta-hydroxy-delta5-steroid dehydrogenase [Reticulomyxa filosa]|eukprot:ETO29388.1 3-beta-hydroxy-delta5-steroid dehydrogenase [Reticulomyxa filosa]